MQMSHQLQSPVFSYCQEFLCIWLDSSVAWQHHISVPHQVTLEPWGGRGHCWHRERPFSSGRGTVEMLKSHQVTIPGNLTRRPFWCREVGPDGAPAFQHHPGHDSVREENMDSPKDGSGMATWCCSGQDMVLAHTLWSISSCFRAILT